MSDQTAPGKYRKLALNLFLAPTTILLLFILAAIYDPGLIIEYWRFYLPMFGIPYVLSLVLWLYSRKLEARHNPPR